MGSNLKLKRWIHKGLAKYIGPSRRWPTMWSVEGAEGEVAQLCPTLCDPMDCSLPGSSVHGIFQARILE